MRQCHAVDVRVVEGEEGKPSESFVSLGGGRIGFDTPNRLHYLATRGQSISLVQEQRKEDQAGRATLALITNGVSLFKTNSTRWPHCNGHALAPSW